MATVDTSGIDDLRESWDRLVRQFPDTKRALLERLAPQMLQAVRRAVGGSGKVAGWQEPHMGSGGGYAAVRPGGPRGSTKPDYHYRPRFKTAAVPGRWFYAAVRQELPGMPQSEIQQLLDMIADGLEGNL